MMFLLYRCMAKPIWQMIKTYDGQTFRFPQKMQLNENLVADFDGSAQMIAVLDNDVFVGHNMLIKEKGLIKCQDIEVETPQRKRGFGALLHALSIMLMKENNAKTINLTSLPQAISFHFHNGFRTAASGTENARKNMLAIMKSSLPYEDLKSSAEKLYWDLAFPNNGSLDRSNALFDEYLKRVIEAGVSPREANIPESIHMSLSMKNVKKNSALYNSILEKFGVDYTI